MQPAEAGIDQDLTIDNRQAREDPDGDQLGREANGVNPAVVPSPGQCVAHVRLPLPADDKPDTVNTVFPADPMFVKTGP